MAEQAGVVPMGEEAEDAADRALGPYQVSPKLFARTGGGIDELTKSTVEPIAPLTEADPGSLEALGFEFARRGIRP